MAGTLPSIVGTLSRASLTRSRSSSDSAAGRRSSFFAEGGFSGVRGLRPFRLGAFETAVSVGASVIPIALSGSRQVLPADTHIPHPGIVHVWIGEPLRATESGWKGAVDLRNRATAAIAEHCGEPRLEAAAVSRLRDPT